MQKTKRLKSLFTRGEKGFTLIELLIVVAIIGIIAAIAVPNLLTAIQRSKQKRSMADMRAIGTALGSYQVDYDEFPIQAAGDFAIDHVGADYYGGSTKDGWNLEYQYYSEDGSSYTMCSYGKDKDNAAATESFEEDILKNSFAGLTLRANYRF